jgi:hypothetical protein
MTPRALIGPSPLRATDMHASALTRLRGRLRYSAVCIGRMTEKSAGNPRIGSSRPSPNMNTGQTGVSMTPKRTPGSVGHSFSCGSPFGPTIGAEHRTPSSLSLSARDNIIEAGETSCATGAIARNWNFVRMSWRRPPTVRKTGVVCAPVQTSRLINPADLHRVHRVGVDAALRRGLRQHRPAILEGQRQGGWTCAAGTSFKVHLLSWS